MEIVRAAGPRADQTALVVPRPLRSGLPFILVGTVILLAGVETLTPAFPSELLAISLALFGVLRASVAHHALVNLRRSADRLLRVRSTAPFTSALMAWRVSELTSKRERAALARSVGKIERDLSPARLPGASPLNRVAARPHAELLRQLAERLAAFERPVAPIGVLRVDDLLTRPDSPLYERERAHELRRSLRTCLFDLEPGPELHSVLGGRV